VGRVLPWNGSADPLLRLRPPRLPTGPPSPLGEPWLKGGETPAGHAGGDGRQQPTRSDPGGMTGRCAGHPAKLVLLRDPTMEDVTAAPLMELVAGRRRGARGHLADPDRSIAVPAGRPEAVRQAVPQSFRCPEVLKESVHQMLSWTLQDIRHREASRVVDRRMTHKPATRINRFLTSPGLIPMFAAGILAEIGAISDFPDDNPWVPPLARTANASNRWDLVDAANSVRRDDDTYVADYQRQLVEGIQLAHHRPLVLTARQRTRWVFARVRDDRAYDPAHPAVRPCPRGSTPPRRLAPLGHPRSGQPEHPRGSTGVFVCPKPRRTLRPDIYTPLS
jgi:hypothetical protein